MEIITHGWHKAKGAVFEDFFGCDVPSHYGDFESEYRAMRNGVALRDISFFGKVRVTGSDRARFLHSMLSNDIKSLAPGKGVWALLLDLKGHIQADLKIYAFPDHLLMVMQHYVLQSAVATLDRYIISEDVTMSDATGAYALFQLFGPDTENYLKSNGVNSLPAELYSYETVDLHGVTCRLIRLGTAFAVLCAAENGPTFLDRSEIPLIGQKAFDVFRIEAGLPLMNRDMDQTNFPQECGLDAALNFQKGCYLGQETMARIDAQGHVNRHLMGVVAEQELHSGEVLFKGEREAGRVTSANFSLRLRKPVALAYVRREFAREGETLAAGDNRTTVVVKKLPLTLEGGQ